MADPEVTEIKPPQVLRERVRRDHDAALAPRSAVGGLPSELDRAHLAELLKPETLRRNADSLPVLAAFQEFLDVERRRTRGRMLALTFLFLVLLLVAGGVAGLFGLTYYRKTHAETRAVQMELAELRTELGASYSAVGAISNMVAQTTVLQSTVDKEITALAGEHDGLSMQVAGMNTNLAGLHSTIARLQSENAQLSERVTRSAAEWQMMTNQVDRIMDLLARTPPRAQPAETGGVAGEEPPTPEVSLSPVPPARESIVLAIIPKDAVHAVDWRVPLPSTRE